MKPIRKVPARRGKRENPYAARAPTALDSTAVLREITVLLKKYRA